MEYISYSDIALKISSTKIALVPEKEGAYGAPDGQIISLLKDLLCCKYSIDAAYRSFADRVRGPWRDALVEHWKDHAKEERSAAYDIAMKIVGMGGDPFLHMLSIPECPANVEALCACLAQMELNLIETSRALIGCSGDNTAIRVMAENIILIDTQHLDDLKRMCVQLAV